MRTFAAVFLFFFCSAIFATPPRIDLKVDRYTLPNGLTVLLQEDHNVPLISYHTWYRVGSRDEGEGVTGAAHMLEHMMFKGSKNYTGPEYEQILHENGITNNAFTTADYTGFYETLPSSKLELMMKMEVDRMRFLKLQPEDLTSELQVVGEERRWRVDNNPSGLLHEAFNDTIYTKHPYHWPVIGYMKDIQAYTVEKLKKFYDQFYVPNNAVLVLVGDFDSAKAKVLIAKYYGDLKPNELPARSYPAEPPRKKPASKVVKGEVEGTHLIIGYPGVAAGAPDSYAMDLLAAMEGAGSSSRMYKRLAYQLQTVTSTGAYNSTSKDPGTIDFSASMKPGKDWRAAADEIRKLIAKIRSEKIGAKELQKVKNQVMKDFVDGLESTDEKAQALAINEIYFGDYRKMFSDMEKYDQVTVADVERVAKKYLQPQYEVTVVLEPSKGKK